MTTTSFYKKVTFIAYFALLLALGAAPFSWRSLLIRNIFLLLGIFLTLWWAKCKHFTFGPVVLWALSMTGVSFLSALLSINPVLSLHRVLGLYLFATGAAWIFWCVAQRHPKWLKEALGYSVIISLLVGLVRLAHWLLGWYTFTRGFVPLLPSRLSVLLWPHPNLFAHILAVGAILFLLLSLEEKRTLPRWLWKFLFALSLLEISLTGSRGGAVGLGAGLLLFLGFYYSRFVRRWQLRKFKILLEGLLWSVYIGGLLVIMSWVRGVFGKEKSLFAAVSLSGRETYWKAAIEMWRDHPWLGVGPGNYTAALFQYVSIPPVTPQDHAHNVALHLMAEVGTLGLLVAIVGFFIVVFSRGGLWRHDFSRFSPENRFALAALFYWMIHGIVEGCIYTHLACLLVWWALWVMALPQGRGELVPAREPGKYPHVISSWAVSILMSILLMLGLGFNLKLMSPLLRPWQSVSASSSVEAGRTILLQSAEYTSSPMLFYFAGYLAAQEAWEDITPLFSHAKPRKDLLRDAIQAYQESVRREPWHSLGWANLALLLWQNDQRVEAIAAMEEAISRAPRSGSFHLLLGWMQEEIGEDAKALQNYCFALQRFPAWSEGVFFVEGTPVRERALECASSSLLAFRSMMAADPCMRVQSLLLQEKVAEAERMLPQCRAQNAYFLLSTIRIYKGASIQEASVWMDWIRRYYSSPPPYIQVYLWGLQGEAWFSRGNCQYAVRSYKQAFIAASQTLQRNAEGWVVPSLPEIRIGYKKFVPGGPPLYPPVVTSTFLPHYMQCQSQETTIEDVAITEEAMPPLNVGGR